MTGLRLLVLCAFSLTLLGMLPASTRAEEAPADPAPATDRVGFPMDYAKTFTILRRRADTTEQVTVYGNTAAASIMELAALPYPNGSILVMETMRLKAGADGKPVEDAITGLHVMRREVGFGADYGANRAGEWEFVEYRPDGSYITPPPKSASCSACHLKDAGPARDFVFKARFAE